MINALIAALTFGQCLLTAHLLALRAKHANVYIPLAGFFTVLAVFHAYHIAKLHIITSNVEHLLPELALAKQIIELSLAPLFWFYIRELTSEHSSGFKKTDLLHLIAPLIVALGLFSVVSVSPFQPAPGADEPLPISFMVRLNEGLNITILVQLFCYAMIVFWRLSKYQNKLKGLFSNTENLMKLTWFRLLIVLIVITLLIEGIAQFFYFTREIPDSLLVINSVLRAVIVWFLAAWGLRQRPELLLEIERTRRSSLAASKYQKSAMDQSRLVEIAAKVRAALNQGGLYRDPNISLRRLAEEIQVLPNYVSQALNSEINETFFDYVNQLRIKDAMQRLKASDDTVLKISIDVGFNSRSSFYSAFKRITGITPAAYRRSPKTI